MKTTALALCFAALAAAAPKNLPPSDWAAIRAAHNRHARAVQPDASGFRARNPGQRWSTRFDGRGFEVTPDRASWRWGLALESYGFAGSERRVSSAKMSAAGDRVSYRWDDRLTEWFINERRGLEHGFTLARRPAGGAGPLVFHLAVRGTLEPRVTDGGRLVAFTAKRAPVVNYAGLKVTDSRGRELPARFVAENAALRLEIDEKGAAYPVTVDPIAQQAYLKPAAFGTTQERDFFGRAVAVSGDTVVVGAPYEDSSSTGIDSTPNENSSRAGAAYVFVRTAGVWSQQAYLKPTSPGADDYFGYSVGISGDTIVVGAHNEDSSTQGVNSTANDNRTNTGAVYVFTRAAGVWTQQAYIKQPPGSPARTGVNFGEGVAISGDTLVVGSPGEDSGSLGVDSTPDTSSNAAGAVFVLTRSAGVWSYQAYLKPAAVGSTQEGDHFGQVVAISGDTVVVGAPEEDSTSTGVNSTPNDAGSRGGAAYIFARSGGVWTQEAYLKPGAVGTTSTDDNFGWAVAVSGDTVVVGAPFEDSSSAGVNSTPNETGPESGAVYVFVRSAGVWTQQAYLKPTTVGTYNNWDEFGITVGVSGDTIVVGALGEDGSATGVNGVPDETVIEAGAAYVFTRTAGVWSEHAYLKPAAFGVTQYLDSFGTAVAIADGLIVVGAPEEDSSTTGVNSAADEAAFDAGAVYIFTVPATEITPLFTISRSAPVLNRGTGHFSQKVTLVNNGDALTSAALVLDYLPAGVSVYQPSGVTVDTAPAGNPYRELGSIAAGATVTVTIEFTRTGTQSIAYTPRLLGPGSR